MDISKLLSPQARNAPPPKFTGAIGDDVAWNFDQGHPSWDSFPSADLVRIAGEVIEKRGPVVLDYFDQTYGYQEVYYGSVLLREQIARHLSKTWGQNGSADGILVTNGSVQGVALAIASFVGSNDAVFVEAATFPYATRFTEAAGGRVYPVPVEDDGMDIDELKRQIRRARAEGHPPKLIYTIATFQMPTGKVLSLAKRKAMLDIATEENIVVLEDNIYGVFRYDGDALPTLLSLDRDGVVMQSDSFAKTTAPGVRLGWVSGTPALVDVLAGVRQDFGPNQWLEAVMTQYLEEGLLDEQIARVVPRYRAKRDVAADALEENCAPLVRFDKPPGSFYYWLQLSPEVDVAALARATRARGLLARPGEMFMGVTSGPQYMRLAFAHVSEASIARGVAQLAKALVESTQ
jgi:2-aminoadipate transaminase